MSKERHKRGEGRPEKEREEEGKENRRLEKEKKKPIGSVPEKSATHLLTLENYLLLKLFFGLLEVLLGQDFVLLPHLIHDLSQVQAWSSIHLHVDIGAQLPAQGIDFLWE